MGLTPNRNPSITTPMKAAIVAVGEEVLRGEVANTNAVYLSKSLIDSGIDMAISETVGDSIDEITKALELATSMADIVITVGGLGPTQDDLTKQAVAQFLGLGFRLDHNVTATIDAIFAARGMTTPEINYNQAQVPEGAEVLPNSFGTAPGFFIKDNEKIYIMLPGPPRELVPMWENHVLPKIASTSKTFSRDFHVFGLTESETAQKLADLMTAKEPPFLAPYASPGDIRLRLWARTGNAGEFENLSKPAIELMQDRIGKHLFDETIEIEAGKILKANGWTIATAESCTGGLIAKTLTDVAGSSEYFLGGAVTYSNEAKMKILGVSEESLATFGAVSQQVALEMAEGARKVFGSSVAISTTGIAGPGGATPEKPVGLVYIGLATPRKTEVFREVSSGTRSDVRHRTLMFALTKLLLIADHRE